MSESLTSEANPSSPPKGELAADAAGQVAGQATDQAKNVTQAAKEQTKAVAQTAQEQARTVGAEAQHHARRVMRDTGGEVEVQLDQRVRQLTQTARSSSDELRALAEGRTDDAGRMGEFATQAARTLSSWSDRAEELGPRGLADEAARLARRRPLAFLAGAAAAGFLIGRVLRNAGGDDEADGGYRGVAGAPDLTDGTAYGDAFVAPPLGPLGAGAPTLPSGDPGFAAPGTTPGQVG